MNNKIFNILIIIFIIIFLIYNYDFKIKKFFLKQQFVRKYLMKTQYSKALKYSSIVTNHIEKGGKILDFGTATGCMTKVLRHNYTVYPLDVIDQSILHDVKPQIYECNKNNCKIPYDDKFFDCGIAMGVLHHTYDPIHLLKELKRTCKKIIICEDIYDSIYEKYKTFMMDSIVNFELKEHPHNNNDDEGWKNIFKKLNLKLIKSYYLNYNFFKHGIYVLSE